MCHLQCMRESLNCNVSISTYINLEKACCKRGWLIVSVLQSTLFVLLIATLCRLMYNFTLHIVKLKCASRASLVSRTVYFNFVMKH